MYIYEVTNCKFFILSTCGFVSVLARKCVFVQMNEVPYKCRQVSEALCGDPKV